MSTLAEVEAVKENLVESRLFGTVFSRISVCSNDGKTDYKLCAWVYPDFLDLLTTLSNIVPPGISVEYTAELGKKLAKEIEAGQTCDNPHCAACDAGMPHTNEPPWLSLACLLFSYDADAPHITLPDLEVGAEENQYYPTVAPDEFLKWLGEPHNGDCVKRPSPCIRCHAEYIAHQAKWLVEKLLWSEPTGTTEYKRKKITGPIEF